MSSSRRIFVSLSILLAAAAHGCGGGGGVTPEPDPPVITVEGVTDGAVIEGPVTITIGVDVGTWSATLNGDPFFSGTSVSEPDEYVLRVTAAHQGKTSEKVVSFRISPPAGGVLVIRLFDLGANDAGGGGDAILLTDSTSAGLRHMMVDAGPAGVGGSDPGFVSRRLAELGVDTLQVLLLTHAHSDHFDGMADILRDVHVQTFYYDGQVRSFSRYQETVSLARDRAQSVVVPEEVLDSPLGLTGATRIRVLPPLTTWLGDPDADASQINDGSLGVRLDRGTFTMFLAGDGEVEANQRWRTAFGALTQDLVALKVGHHGANDAVFDNGFSGSSAWLGHTDAQLQVISANGTTHPRMNALSLLLGRPATHTWCTNVHGDIEIRVDVQGSYTVTAERNVGMDCEPGTEAGT